MKNKHLLIILIGLLAIYLGTKLFSNKGSERNFQSELIDVDSNAVFRVEVKLPGSEYTLKKESDGWYAYQDDLKVKASSGAVNSLLGIFNNIKAKQLVSRNPEKWIDYEVDNEKGAEIRLFDDKDAALAACIFGRFNFNQQTRAGISYLRLADSDEVYAVDGFAALSAKQEFNGFRNKTLTKLNKADIKSIRLSKGQNLANIVNTPEGWQIDGQAAIDSTTMDQYLSALSNLNGQEFLDHLDPGNLQAEGQLSITADNSSGITLTSYLNPDAENSFVIHSSANPDAYFQSDSSGIYKRIFLDLPVK